MQEITPEQENVQLTEQENDANTEETALRQEDSEGTSPEETAKAPCDECRKAAEEINRLSAENAELKSQLERMKGLPHFSAKSAFEKSGGDAIRSIFRRK